MFLKVRRATGAGLLLASFYAQAQGASVVTSPADSSPAPAASATAPSDRSLRRHVLTALAKAKGLRATGITVQAHGGAVVLEGWAPEEAQIDLATRIASNVQGVKSVRNLLTLSTF
ncbi:putative lipoprotein [Candidatus Paraburkholderia schumanniana]|nr:putative lipoprotein [Candidatus Paraburkholderia schumannianae]